MCGFIAAINNLRDSKKLEASLSTLFHRGPDMEDMQIFSSGKCVLGHRRLSIIDLSQAGKQPMSDTAGRYWIALNGEIYNYLELKKELSRDYEFRTHTDTEVLLAAYKKWGDDCLNRLIGMFAFIIWDDKDQALFAARDRFGVKPFYYSILPSGELILASEIKAIHATGLTPEADAAIWATYFSFGLYDHSERTFYKGVNALAPGSSLRWHNGDIRIRKWYDLAERIGDNPDTRDEKEVMEEYLSLMQESIRLRFRSDVAVGINLSGGLDSSVLLWLVQTTQGEENQLKVFTFVSADERYDELPWVKQMLTGTVHPHYVCRLKPQEVPELAKKVQRYQDEPFGGIPTLAYSKVFEEAKKAGVIVLLDGQGLDEQWAGYDYYARALSGQSAEGINFNLGFLQGGNTSGLRADCLTPEFRRLAEALNFRPPFSDRLSNLQYRDICYTKLPRALRFNDRISMMYSTELREPFLDHRLLELALSQPRERKINHGVHKYLLRKMMTNRLPKEILESPKRPLQTPQREWLRGALKEWADSYIEKALSSYGGRWLDADSVRREWREYCSGKSDNSFYVFQWVNLGLWSEPLQSKNG